MYTILYSVYLLRVDWTSSGTATKTGIAVLRRDKGKLVGGMYDSCVISRHRSCLMRIQESATLGYAGFNKSPMLLNKLRLVLSAGSDLMLTGS